MIIETFEPDYQPLPEKGNMCTYILHKPMKIFGHFNFKPARYTSTDSIELAHILIQTQTILSRHTSLYKHRQY